MTPKDAVAAAGGFLADLRLRSVGPEGALLVEGVFDASSYRPELYRALDIATPPALEALAPRRQADFLAGRVAAAIALGGLGLAAVEIPIGPGRAPRWPEGVSASISHAQGHVACLAIARPGRLVGVDLEAVASGEALRAIRSHCLLPSERGLTDGLRPLAPEMAPDMAPDMAATLLFSAKETLFKACYPRVQRFFGFECAEAIGLSGAGEIAFRLTEDLHPEFRAGLSIRIGYETTSDRVLTRVVLP